jgi:tetratricopeptide (TPR) repeat protein
MNIFHTDIFVLTENLFKLERCGRYEEALAELRHIWEDTNSFPDVDDFAPRTAAEIFLRCGAVIGFLGQIKQIPNSQEKSKNLLTEAHKRFLDIYDVEKIIECENYLALAYTRTGELVEAKIWVEEALSHQLNKLSDAWIYANLTQSLIYLLDKKYKQTVKALLPLEVKFLELGNDFLLGSFCTNLSLAYKNLGNPRESLKYLELARKYHQKSGHQIYLGTVENNLSQLYKSEKRFDEAHQAADNAVKIFRKLKDRAREGFTLDTKAQIFCLEDKYSKALETIEKAIFILSKGENAAFLVETFLTKAKILLYLEDFNAAFLCLSDAVQVAKTKISEEKAENLVKEFREVLDEKRVPVVSRLFSEKQTGKQEKIELVLHPTIAHYQDFQGVWIKNSHLESYGLGRNSLAVVTKTELKRGDLVAINEISTDSVMCGFYDSDFGLVCLEGIDDEPRFFNESEIEILGKIVGVGKSDKNSKGKIEVKPLNL